MPLAVAGVVPLPERDLAVTGWGGGLGAEWEPALA